MRTHATSPRAALALALVESLQRRLTGALERVAARTGAPAALQPTSWLRDDGAHGGGERWGIGDHPRYDRASVNVSQVHYDDLPDRRLASATALSAIVHPRHPLAPSVHLHTSWTELRDGTGYWRIMADLNPSHPDADEASAFRQAWRVVAPREWAHAEAQGDRYFQIPALGRTRGVAHFYLEAHASGDFDADLALARAVEEAAIDTWASLVTRRLSVAPEPTADQLAVQRAYHTAYVFQVLLLDRGTTSGLLVHDQNDLGILGSLPSRVDPALLRSWAGRVGTPQDELVNAIADAVGPEGAVTDEVKLRLAAQVRTHFRAHPEALEQQARGDVVPPTVANHGR